MFSLASFPEVSWPNAEHTISATRKLLWKMKRWTRRTFKPAITSAAELSILLCISGPHKKVLVGATELYVSQLKSMHILLIFGTLIQYFSQKLAPFCFTNLFLPQFCCFLYHLYNSWVQLAYKKRLHSAIPQLKWLLCLSNTCCNQFNICSSADHSDQPQMKMPFINIPVSQNFCITNDVLMGKCIQSLLSGLFLVLHQDLTRWFPTLFFPKAIASAWWESPVFMQKSYLVAGFFLGEVSQLFIFFLRPLLAPECSQDSQLLSHSSFQEDKSFRHITLAGLSVLAHRHP